MNELDSALKKETFALRLIYLANSNFCLPQSEAVKNQGNLKYLSRKFNLFFNFAFKFQT